MGRIAGMARCVVHVCNGTIAWRASRCSPLAPSRRRSHPATFHRGGFGAACVASDGCTAFAQRAPRPCVPAKTTQLRKPSSRAGGAARSGDSHIAIKHMFQEPDRRHGDVRAGHTYLRRKTSTRAWRQPAGRSSSSPNCCRCNTDSWPRQATEGQPAGDRHLCQAGHCCLRPTPHSCNFNMAVTYRESLNKPDEARSRWRPLPAPEPLHPWRCRAGAHASSGYTRRRHSSRS